jgi:hypothetical protein
MPFSYYTRLTRSEQAVYRRSDEIHAVRLPSPSALWPLIGALQGALECEDRARTQAAAAELVNALNAALGIPRVRVDVLAARPHRGWGELHGLYTSSPGTTAKIQLWMRTARQRRVVAFRTFLRTLLHEVGHHIDYTWLRLAESYHTEGFYKRESSLFHQLVPEASATAATASRFGCRMPVSARARTRYADLPVGDRLERLERGPGDLARLVRGRSERALTRRADLTSWSARDIVCHVRDTEETVRTWLTAALASDDEVLRDVAPAGADPAHGWASEHVGEAWTAFSRRRDETVTLLGGLRREEWRRSARDARGEHVTIDDIVTLTLVHDDHHTAEVARVLGSA